MDVIQPGEPQTRLCHYSFFSPDGVGGTGNMSTADFANHGNAFWLYLLDMLGASYS